MSKLTHNGYRLGDGGFYTQRIFKTAIAKPVLYEGGIFTHYTFIEARKKKKKKMSVGNNLI